MYFTRNSRDLSQNRRKYGFLTVQQILFLLLLYIFSKIISGPVPGVPTTKMHLYILQQGEAVVLALKFRLRLINNTIRIYK